MRATSIVGISAFCALLCACGAHEHGGSAPVPGTAERVVHYYNWANYIGPDTIPAFEAATGIKVIYDAYDSEETLETVILMGDTGYDVVGSSMGTFATGIAAGAFTPLDRTRLPNWRHLDPHALAVLGQFDPGNRYAVPFLHSINGFAYNIDKVRARMPDAPVDSLDMLFKPDVVARFADCGVSFLDSPVDVIQLALAYLHLDPNSQRIEDLKAAEQVVMAIRPYIRTFDSNLYFQQLASNEICLAIAWSSDYFIAQERARENGTGAHLAFTLPKEGSNITYNAFLIPASAPHPEAAHKFLNFILDPKVIAEITNDIHYGNDNLAARPFVGKDILDDPAIYPSPEVRAKLYLPEAFGPDYDRQRTRVWTRIKTGQ